jgi:hypothetical protein
MDELHGDDGQAVAVLEHDRRYYRGLARPRAERSQMPSGPRMTSMQGPVPELVRVVRNHDRCADHGCACARRRHGADKSVPQI